MESGEDMQSVCQRMCDVMPSQKHPTFQFGPPYLTRSFVVVWLLLHIVAKVAHGLQARSNLRSSLLKTDLTRDQYRVFKL